MDPVTSIYYTFNNFTKKYCEQWCEVIEDYSENKCVIKTQVFFPNGKPEIVTKKVLKKNIKYYREQETTNNLNWHKGCYFD